MAAKYWLLKAEPDPRIVKGKDVKFSVDDFEAVKTSPWEGVRNYEARNLMKEMKVGDKALFYHSNCKIPGIAGFAEVSEEAYPDYTAWDPSHPYFDPKSDKSNPKWFMVNLTFSGRVEHFVPLVLLRHIADNASTSPPKEIEYIGESGVAALKGMDLVTRGRLSVQRVDKKAWDTIQMLAEKGGWEELDLKPKKNGAKSRAGPATKKAAGKGRSGGTKAGRPQAKAKAKLEIEEEVEEMPSEEGEDDGDDDYEEEGERKGAAKRKRKARDDDDDEDFRPKRKARAKK